MNSQRRARKRAAKKTQRPGKKTVVPGWGGRREGSGRQRGINWAVVKRKAGVGCTEEEIITALEIRPELLKDQETSERLRREVAVGNARHKVQVREKMHQQAIKRDSVNALGACARNELGWDQPSAQVSEEAPQVDAPLLLNLLAQLKAGGGPHGSPTSAP